MSVRPQPVRSLLGVALWLSVTLAPGNGRADGVVSFPAQSLPDGTSVPAHRVFTGDGSDRAALLRHRELTRAPYMGVARDHAVREGLVLRAAASLSTDAMNDLAAGLERVATRLYDKDGWSAPFSKGSPLRVLVSPGRDGVSAAAWAGREKGGRTLTDPIVSVTGGERPVEALLLDAAHGLAVVTLRRAAPAAPSWVVDALAESMARGALGWAGEPLPSADDPLRSEAGDARDPVVLAALFDRLVPRLPSGAAELRAVWEDTRGGADAESFLRDLGSRADARGLAGVLADLVASRLAALPPASAARRAGGDLAIASPGPLAWRRVALTTAGERGGLELQLPELSPGAARAVVFYRGESGGFDAASLEPGAAKRFPLAGTTELAILLVDGDARDVAIRARRLFDYPAALAAAAAEREETGVRISWKTSHHRDLLAWAVVRFDEGDDGRLVEASRELVPTSAASDTEFEYVIVDRGDAAAKPGVYRVFALTTEGFLSEAFEAIVPAGAGAPSAER